MWDGENFITQQEFSNRFGYYPRQMLDYNVICNALRAFGIEREIPEENNLEELTPPCVQEKLSTMNRKCFYEIGHTTEEPHINNFWLRKYQIDLSQGYWNVAPECTKETRLRVLQWKILHNIWPTNIMLKKMGIKQTENCSWCGVKDFSEHFFFSCTALKGLWQLIKSKIEIHLGIKINLDEKTVMLGMLTRDELTKNQINTINHAILIGKLTVSKFKYGNSKLIENTFESECSYRKLWRTGK